MKVELTKHYPPDTTAALKWLFNRQPDKWREGNKQEAHDARAMLQESLERKRYAKIKSKELLDKLKSDQ
jgi:hypothetical protein